MKTNALGITLLLALAAVPLSAQRAIHAGTAPRFSPGGFHGSASSRFVPHAAARSYFAPVVGAFYPSNFVVPAAYSTTPYPESANGGPMVIVAPSSNEGSSVVYIPSYMRPQNGPSLGEIAAQLKAQHTESAKYVWKNVEPVLPPKDDPPK